MKGLRARLFPSLSFRKSILEDLNNAACVENYDGSKLRMIHHEYFEKSHRIYRRHVDSGFEEPVSHPTRGFVSNLAISSDEARAAYLVDEALMEYHTLFVRDMANNKMLEDVRNPQSLPVKAVVFGGRYLYVTTSEEEDLRPSKCWVMDCDRPRLPWQLIATEEDPTMLLDLGSTKDGHFIRLSRRSYNSGSDSFIPSNDPHAQPITLLTDGSYSVDHINGLWIAIDATNHQKTVMKKVEQSKEWETVFSLSDEKNVALAFADLVTLLV